MSYTTLIGAAQLAQHSSHNNNNTNNNGSLVILDCQTSLADLDEGYRIYCDGHLPGAKHADLDIHGAGAPGAEGRHPLPDPHELLQHMQRWGIHNNSQVVVYDRANGAFAARFWWCLRWLGHHHVAVLDGGLNQYTGPLETGADPTRDTSATPANLGTCTRRPALTRTATTAQVMERTTQTQANLIDARTQERFDGLVEPIDPIAGHIPGAHCLPFQGNLDSNGCFAAPEVLAERFASAFGPNQANLEPICYCGSGVTAAHNVLAMVYAGLPEPWLYPPSWSGWITDPTRPLSANKQTPG